MHWSREAFVLSLLITVWAAAGTYVVVRRLRMEKRSLLNLLNPMVVCQLRARDYLLLLVIACCVLAVAGVAYSMNWIE